MPKSVPTLPPGSPPAVPGDPIFQRVYDPPPVFERIAKPRSPLVHPSTETFTAAPFVPLFNESRSGGLVVPIPTLPLLGNVFDCALATNAHIISSMTARPIWPLVKVFRIA